mmetsp:Transcript_14217/g.60850  ORF Transcript_14217/g.60850 Transcript_14217/m.60850 type:complete len:410 (-) Transcript_14217:134-1363(-)
MLQPTATRVRGTWSFLRTHRTVSSSRARRRFGRHRGLRRRVPARDDAVEPVERRDDRGNDDLVPLEQSADVPARDVGALGARAELRKRLEELRLVLPHEPIPRRAHLHHRPDRGRGLFHVRVPPPPRHQTRDLRQTQALHGLGETRLDVVQRLAVFLRQRGRRFVRRPVVVCRRPVRLREHRLEVVRAARGRRRERVPRDAAVQHAGEERRRGGRRHHRRRSDAFFAVFQPRRGDDRGDVRDAPAEADAGEHDTCIATVRRVRPGGDARALRDAGGDLRYERAHRRQHVRKLFLRFPRRVVREHQDDARDVVLQQLERYLLAEVVKLVPRGGEVHGDLSRRRRRGGRILGLAPHEEEPARLGSLGEVRRRGAFERGLLERGRASHTARTEAPGEDARRAPLLLPPLGDA